LSLKTKPNTFGYLLPTSNHPKHICKNIPTNLIKRIRKICSSIIDYFHFSRLLFIQLIKRKYNPQMLCGIIRNEAKIDRLSLLPYKDDENNNFLNKNAFFIFQTFDFNFNYLRSCIYNYFAFISNNFSSTYNKRIVILNRIKTNIGSLLIHKFPLEETKNFKYKSCYNLDCLVCKYAKTN
jgi:hypothetical protein